MPLNMAASSSTVTGGGGGLTMDQLQLMSRLAQQHQRPVYPPMDAAVLGHMQQPVPLPVNSATVRPQPHQLRGNLTFFFLCGKHH